MKNSKVILKSIVFATGLTPLGWLIFGLWSDTFYGTKMMTVDPVQETNRELGKWALNFILITLAVRPLHEFSKNFNLLIHRRMIGLFAFFYTVLHLGSYMAIDLQFELIEFIKDITKRNFIIVGMIAATLMVPLAVTSNKKMIVALGGKRWRRLHWLIYPVAVLAILHFFMMVKAGFLEPLIYSAVLTALLAFRGGKKISMLWPSNPL